MSDAMSVKATVLACSLSLCSLFVLVHSASGADADDAPPAATTNANGSVDARYGLFDGLDHRSVYTQEVFPEPFLVDDMAWEDSELEFTWLHTKASGNQTDIGTGEIQKGIGMLTLEVEFPYERDAGPGQTDEGIAPIDLGARYPLYQFVSANRFVDATFGVGMEGSIPVHLALGRDAEIEPQIFNTLALGQRFTIQTVLGYSMLFGGHDDDDGDREFEYGFSFAYALPCGNVAPGVQQLIPMFEIDGDRGLNHDEARQNDVLADAGFRLQLKHIDELQPNVGVAYVFPLDREARNDVHWGFIVSLIFDF